MSFLYDRVLRPMLFSLDAERAHEIGKLGLKLGVASGGLSSREKELLDETFGPIQRFGLKFVNPLGVAAGFDKNGEVVDQLAGLGFGFVEVGTVTFEPQKGNDKPRLFRLPTDEALINRLGFNNEGALRVATRLKAKRHQCVVGVNIGRNRDVKNEVAVENYLAVLDVVHPVADYIAVNVSSPNTEGLRDLQAVETLAALIEPLSQRNQQFGKKPLLVKIAPDLEEAEIDAIVDMCTKIGVEGIIAANTTTSRAGLATPDVEKFGAGGLSGRPLASRSTHIISQIYGRSGGKLPIVGVGGIFSGQDAFDKIAAGASLVQAYTGFVYKGPTFARNVLLELARILRDKGFRSLDEAIGSRVR